MSTAGSAAAKKNNIIRRKRVLNPQYHKHMNKDNIVTNGFVLASRFNIDYYNTTGLPYDDSSNSDGNLIYLVYNSIQNYATIVEYYSTKFNLIAADDNNPFFDENKRFKVFHAKSVDNGVTVHEGYRRLFGSIHHAMIFGSTNDVHKFIENQKNMIGNIHGTFPLEIRAAELTVTNHQFEHVDNIIAHSNSADEYMRNGKRAAYINKLREELSILQAEAIANKHGV